MAALKVAPAPTHSFYEPNKATVRLQLRYALESIERDDPVAAVRQLHAAMGAALACARYKDE